MRPLRPIARMLAILGLLAVAGAARAVEERVVDGVGAVAVKGAAGGRSGTPRDAALRAAIVEAVRRVALELLPADAAATDPEAAVDAALAPDLRAFANRFRILEDRGEGPALLVEEPGVQTEYVMVVQAQVDVGRVRQRLVRAGLLPAGDLAPSQRLRIVIEDLDGYAGYRAVRTLLDDLGVRGAVPVQMDRGTAVLEVESRLPASELLAQLVRSAPPELRLDAVASDAESLTLRAHFLAQGAAP
jgi:hypothetical protein